MLNICNLHISKYSGSIAEAALMKKPSLIVDEIGVKSFQSLIDSEKAFSCLSNNPEEIIIKIENIIDNGQGNLEKINDSGYEKIIDEFIK